MINRNIRKEKIWMRVALIAIFSLSMSTARMDSAQADEGTAVADAQSAVAAGTADIPDSSVSSAAEQSQSSSAVSTAWSNTKKFFSNGVSLGSAGGIKPRIRPHLHGESGWTSNADLGRSNSGAWEGRLSPGITVDIPMGDKLYGSAGYTYTHSRTHGRRINEHANSHNIDALLRYDATAKTALGLREDTRWNEMPGQPGNMFFLQTLSPEIKHQFGTQLSTGLQYIYQHYRDITERSAGAASGFFRSAISNDTFNDHAIIATSEYKVGSNLAIGPSFQWSTRDFAKTPAKDYWQISPTIGGSYTLGPKTKLGGHFGWAYRNFDVGDGFESELVYGAKLTHLMGKKVTWGLHYDKSLTDTFDTKFIFNPVAPEASNLDSYDRHFRVIKNHRLGTTIGYNFNEKNSVGAHFNFQASSADGNDNIASTVDDKSREKQIETGFSYMYRITKYLSLRLGYAFGRSFEAKDNPARSVYTFHKIIAGVNVAF